VFFSYQCNKISCRFERTSSDESNPIFPSWPGGFGHMLISCVIDVHIYAIHNYPGNSLSVSVDVHVNLRRLFELKAGLTGCCWNMAKAIMMVSVLWVYFANIVQISLLRWWNTFVCFFHRTICIHLYVNLQSFHDFSKPSLKYFVIPSVVWTCKTLSIYSTFEHCRDYQHLSYIAQRWVQNVRVLARLKKKNSHYNLLDFL